MAGLVDTKKKKKVVISEIEELPHKSKNQAQNGPLKSALKTLKGVLKKNLPSEPIYQKAEDDDSNRLKSSASETDLVLLESSDEDQSQDDSSDDSCDEGSHENLDSIEEEESSRNSDSDSEEVPSAKRLKKGSGKLKRKTTAQKTGVIYLGRIPHGFHEEEMKSYFSQFGDVCRLRLSRSKKTGNSKHYAFIEFKHQQVAKIVAETLHNYLLCGSLLQCKLLERNKIHPGMWVGSGKKFRKDWKPDMKRREYNQPRTLLQQQKITSQSLKKEELKRKRLAELGIDYDFTGYSSQTLPKTITNPSQDGNDPDLRRSKKSKLHKGEFLEDKPHKSSKPKRKVEG